MPQLSCDLHGKEAAMKTKQITPMRKLETIHALYRAVGDYVVAHGGLALTAGGIQIIQWPSDTECNYTVGVKVTGKRPKFPEKRQS